MANNLEITADLNKLLIKQNVLLITQAKIQKAQLGVMIQMAAVFKEIDPGQFAGTMSELDEAIQSASSSTEKLGENTQNLTENFDKMGKEVSHSMGLMDQMDVTSNKFTTTVKKMLGPEILGGLSGAFFGLKAAHAVVTGLANVFGGLVETAWNLTTAVIAIPFKILGALFDNAIQGGSEYRRLLEDIRKEFGDLTKNSAKAVKALGTSMKGELAETGLSVYRVFGNLVERTQALFGAAKALGATFGLLRESISENVEVFAAYYKGLGVSDEAFKSLGARAASAGRSILDIGNEMVQFADSMGTAFRINAREITKDVGEMVHDIHNFGNLGVKELSQVSVYAHKLGIEFQKLTGVIDAFDNFEKAAEGVAQLSQAFGLNVDAVKLSQEQDPAARMEMLRKAFFATGRSVENMSRQELRLLSAQTGLDEQTAKTVFGLKSQGTSYADIQKAGDSATKKTLTQEEAMQKLSGSIDRLVKDGAALQGGLFERFFTGFLKGVQLSVPFRQMMREITRSLQIVYREGRLVGKAFVELFPGVKNIFKAMKELFDADRFRKSMNDIRWMFGEFFKGLTKDPQTSLKALMDRLKRAFFNFFDNSSGAGRKLIGGFKEFFSTILKVAAAGLRIGIRGLIDTVKGLIDIIRDPSSLMAAGGEATGIAGQILEMFMPVVDALKEMLPPLWEVLKDLFSELGTKALDLLGANAGPIALALGGIFALYISSALIGAVASGVVAGAAQKGGMLLVELLGRSMKGARAGGGSPAAGGLSGVAPATSEAGEVAGAVRRSGLQKGASINWPVVALVVAGVILVAAAIFLLAFAVKEAQIPVSDVMTAVVIMGAAVLLVAALGGLMYEMILIAPALLAAKALIPVIAGVFLLGVAVAGGMFLLILALGGVDRTRAETASLTMLAAIGIVAALGLLVAELGWVAGFALGAVIGVIAVFALGKAIAGAMPAMVEEVNKLDPVELLAAAGVVGSMAVMLGAIAGLATALGIVGAAIVLTGGAAMRYIVTGIQTLNIVTIAVVKNTEILLEAVNRISFSEGFKERFDIFIQMIQAITSFGTMIAALGASVAPGWLEPANQHERNLKALEIVITTIRISLVEVIQAITTAVGAIEGGDEVLVRATAIATVMDALSGVVGGLVPPSDSPFWTTDWNSFEDVGDRLAQYGTTITTILPSLRDLVGAVVEEFTRPEFANAAAAFGTEGGAKAIQGIVSVLEVVGRLGSSLTGTVMTQLRGLRAGTDVTELIDNAVTFVQRIMSALFTGGFLESVGDLITNIVSRTSSLSKEQISRFQTVSPIFTSVFTAISSMGDAISGALDIAGTLENPEAKGEALESIRRFVGEIFDGIGDIATTVIPQLITAFKNLSSGDISKIKSGTSVLSSLFAIIPSITTGISPIYELARSAGGGGTDFASVRKGLGTVFSLFWDAPGQGGDYEGLPTMLNRVARSFSTINVGDVTSFRTTANAVKAMVAQINRVSDSFRSLGDNPLTINAELRRLASNLGVGSKEQFSIRHDSFNVTINVEVKLLIEELEEAVINRPGGSRFTLSVIPGA